MTFCWNCVKKMKRPTFACVVSCSALHDGGVVVLSVVFVTLLVLSVVVLLHLARPGVLVLVLGLGGGEGGLRLDLRHHLLDVVVVHGGHGGGGGGAAAAGYHRSLDVLDLWLVRGLGTRGLGGARTGGVGAGAAAALVLGEPLHPEIFGDGEEVVEILLGHVDLAVVHKVEDRLEIGEADPLHVEEGVLVGVTPEHGAEEGAAGGEDDFVGVDLIIVACEGHVEKVFIISQFSKSPADVRLKVVPLEAELFGAHCWGL